MVLTMHESMFISSIGLKTYSVDQFFNEFYRPELLPKIFQNRGGKEESKSIQGKLKNSPPPSVKIAVLPNSPGKAEVYVRMIDNGNGAENLKLFHNGKNIALDQQALKPPASRGQATTYKPCYRSYRGNQCVFRYGYKQG